MLYDAARQFSYRIVAKQISSFSRYYDSLTQLNKLEWDDTVLFDNVESQNKDQSTIEDITIQEEGTRDLYLLNGNLNYSYNIQEMFEDLYKKTTRSSRVACLVYNHYLSYVFSLLNLFGLRKGSPLKTFVTDIDLQGILRLSQFEMVYEKNLVYFPFFFFGLGTYINKLISLIPFVNRFSFLYLVVIRPVKKATKDSVTIIIPARNEKGNIRSALERIPDLGCPIEVVFVEGNSSDGTWEEIEAVSKEEQYLKKYSIQIMKQPGKGKYDAVKVGFDAAKNDILMILDADLTMPPELLPQFYSAYITGDADFINGSRLVYPMEGEAMKFLNLLGNKFFAKALSILLDFKLSDSLCGTKVFPRKDWKRIGKWRDDFGDFDPFGDFEMLFSAAELKMGIINIPVRYRDRVYGSTQISRFRDGFILLKMTTIAFFKIKFRNL